MVLPSGIILVRHKEFLMFLVGIKQATKLGDRLLEESLDIIITSDLSRAIDTAKSIENRTYY